MTEHNTIAFAADHAGFELKNKLILAAGQVKNWTALDFGTDGAASVDYPDLARPAAAAVANGQARFGVLVCGSGTGMTIAANKTPGVRAANCWTAEIARLAREHNDANVLCIPARFVSEADAIAIMQAFFEAQFAGGRHATRVGKLECC